MATVAARYEEFKQLGADVLSVSVDSVFVHHIWNDRELSKIACRDVPFPMIADPGGKLGELYGVYDPEEGVNMRGRFLIDPDGIIQACEILTPPVGRNVDEAIRQLKAYQHVRETCGKEVCPSGWKPGKKVLKPCLSLSGNIGGIWKVGE